MLKTCCGLDLDVGAFLIASFQLLCSITGLIITLSSKSTYNYTSDNIFDNEHDLFIGFFILNIIANALVFTSLRTKKSSPLILWLFFGLAPSAYLLAALITNLLIDNIRWSNSEITISVLFLGFQIYIWFVMLSLYRTFDSIDSPFPPNVVRPNTTQSANNIDNNRIQIIRTASVSSSYSTECINAREQNDFNIIVNALGNCQNEANAQPENICLRNISENCCASKNCCSGGDFSSCEATGVHHDSTGDCDE